MPFDEVYKATQDGVLGVAFKDVKYGIDSFLAIEDAQLFAKHAIETGDVAEGEQVQAALNSVYVPVGQ